MANPISGARRAVARLRTARPSLDHLIRAFSRYQSDTGDRLAAAVTYFGFLSFFPLIALAFAVLGYLVAYQPGIREQVTSQLTQNFPGLIGGPNGINVDQIAAAKAGAGIIGLLGLLYSGLGWLDALREAIRTIWHQNVTAGNFVARKLKDVLVLGGLGLVLLASMAVSGLTTTITGRLLEVVGLEGSSASRLILSVLGPLAALIIDVALFVYLFIGLPRLHVPVRRVLKGALFAAVGFEVLKLVGAWFVARTTSNPVYGTFAVIVGLLVWINLVTRYLLFAAAWTVTAPFDTDVAPSGTSGEEAAKKAKVPTEFANSDPDNPQVLQRDGAPTPLLAALRGRPAPQDEPEGPPEAAEGASEAAAEGPPEAAAEGPPEGVATGPARERDERATRGGGLGERAARAGRTAPDPYPDEPRRGLARPPTGELPGERMTRTAARVGAGAMVAGAAGLVVYGLRSLRDLVRS